MRTANYSTNSNGWHLDITYRSRLTTWIQVQIPLLTAGWLPENYLVFLCLSFLNLQCVISNKCVIRTIPSTSMFNKSSYYFGTSWYQPLFLFFSLASILFSLSIFPSTSLLFYPLLFCLLLLYYNPTSESHKHYLTYHTWRSSGKWWLKNTEFFQLLETG